MVPGIQTCIRIKESIQEIASKKLRDQKIPSSYESGVVPDRSLLAKRAWQNLKKKQEKRASQNPSLKALPLKSYITWTRPCKAHQVHHLIEIQVG